MDGCDQYDRMGQRVCDDDGMGRVTMMRDGYDGDGQDDGDGWVCCDGASQDDRV